jgi:hypothetical protein
MVILLVISTDADAGEGGYIAQSPYQESSSEGFLAGGRAEQWPGHTMGPFISRMDISDGVFEEKNAVSVANHFLWENEQNFAIGFMLGHARVGEWAASSRALEGVFRTKNISAFATIGSRSIDASHTMYAGASFQLSLGNRLLLDMGLEESALDTRVGIGINFRSSSYAEQRWKPFVNVVSSNGDVRMFTGVRIKLGRLSSWMQTQSSNLFSLIPNEAFNGMNVLRSSKLPGDSADSSSVISEVVSSPNTAAAGSVGAHVSALGSANSLRASERGNSGNASRGAGGKSRKPEK